MECHRLYRFRKVYVDPYQGEKMAEDLRREGVPIELRAQSGGTLMQQASELLSVVREKKLRIYDDEMIVGDLRKASILERPSGGFRLLFTRGSKLGSPHGDAATSLTLALVAAKLHGGRKGIPIVSRPMVYSDDTL